MWPPLSYTERLLAQMSERFEDQKMKCQSLLNICIFIYTVSLAPTSETDNLLEFHQQDVDGKIVTVPEIMRWKEKWKKQDIATLSTNAIDAFKAFDPDLFPNVRKLLAILTMLPITTATNKRSFSTTRRLKT